MEISRRSLAIHVLGLFLLLFGGVETFVTGDNWSVLVGLVGLILLWVIALESDVYSREIDRRVKDGAV